MKKALNFIGKIFKISYKFIDKIIITPIGRLIYVINENIKNNTPKLERILTKPISLVYISLFFAIAVFFLVDSKVISLVETEAEILSDQKVNVIYNEEAYVVEGIPNTVDITLIGRKSDLYLAKQLGDHKVVLDLTGYGVGEHKVKLIYKQTIDSLSYKLDPSSVLVVIREKISDYKNISYDLLNQDKLDAKLSVKNNITLDRSQVVVKGSEESLAKVATVKALIDLNNDDLTDAGSYTLDSVPLVAYDENGEVISNVEIVPSKVTANIVLESYSVEVPIKVVTTGDYTIGYAISSIASSVTKVRIYGEEKELSKIQFVPVTINVSGLKANKTFNENIKKPSGVRYISEQTTSISVTVDSETSKEINNVTVDALNVGSGLTAYAKTLSDTTISVTVKGVSSVLEKFEASNIKAYVDLTGYEVGTHSVPITLEVDDVKVQVVSNVKTIDIVINKK